MKKWLQVGVLLVFVASLVVTAWILHKEQNASIAELEAAMTETEEYIHELRQEVARKDRLIAEKDDVIQKYEPKFQIEKELLYYDPQTGTYLKMQEVFPETASDFAKGLLLGRDPNVFKSGVDSDADAPGDYQALPGPGDYHLEWPPQFVPSTFVKPVDFEVPGPEGP